MKEQEKKKGFLGWRGDARVGNFGKNINLIVLYCGMHILWH